ncbi:MAG TPA: zinc ribbon domain-containing protein [Patescibacteria group bacterium]|nr:zinc ribbon domain-containing protein [Patescibacteria group bacterium]
MPYCPECGKEVEEGAAFCPQCGSPLRGTGATYRRSGSDTGWTVVRIIAIFIGGIIIIAGLGVTAGGFGLRTVISEFQDSEGFLVTREVRLTTDSYALVTSNIDINTDIDIPSVFGLAPYAGEYVTVKIVAGSNEPSKLVFVGIARGSDAEDYFTGVGYDEVRDLKWSYNPSRESQPQIYYWRHEGGAPVQPPSSVDFWEESASGSGTNSVVWVPQGGSFWVVVMNADGSESVDVDIQLGVSVPILRSVGSWLIGSGIAVLLIGGAIIYFVFLSRGRPRKPF